MTATSKKITIATVKSFIKKHRASLLINVYSSFDGMQDMVTTTGDHGFHPIRNREWYDRDTGKYVPVPHDNCDSLGICGVWFVNGSRDRCRVYDTPTHTGYTVYNCCGEWTVAISK